MTKLAIVATAEIAPNRMDEALALLRAHAQRCLEQEPGTEQFQILKPQDAENTLLFYEVYRDDAAFKAHWDGVLVARIRAETQGVLINLTGRRCDLEDVQRQAPEPLAIGELNASNDE